MSESGHFRPGPSPAVVPAMSARPRKRTQNQSIGAYLDGSLQVDGAARYVIQEPKLEPRILRYKEAPGRRYLASTTPPRRLVHRYSHVGGAGRSRGGTADRQVGRSPLTVTR